MCRFIEGDPHTALDRIDSIEGAKTYYDLILFQADCFENKAKDILTNLISKLSNNGAIVVTSTDSQVFLSCWKMAKKLNPKLIFIQCFKEEVGVILNSELVNNCNDDKEKEIHFLNNFWKPIKKRRFIFYSYRVIEIINDSIAKCLYEPFWRWPMIMKKYFIK